MSEDKQKLINDAVEKALAGDADAINNIEDRVTRAKAKAALVKAKREQPEKEDSNDDVSKSDEKELPVHKIHFRNVFQNSDVNILSKALSLI